MPSVRPYHLSIFAFGLVIGMLWLFLVQSIPPFVIFFLACLLTIVAGGSVWIGMWLEIRDFNKDRKI